MEKDKTEKGRLQILMKTDYTKLRLDKRILKKIVNEERFRLGLLMMKYGEKEKLHELLNIYTLNARNHN